MTSPSIPTTSVIWVTLRWPSRMRLTWQIRWTAEAIWVRIARDGEVSRAALEPADMRLLQLQLGGIFNRHNPLRAVDHLRQRVEQRRLAGAGAAGDKDIEPAPCRHLQCRRHCGRNGAIRDHR